MWFTGTSAKYTLKLRKEPFAFTVTTMRILLGSSNEPELNNTSTLVWTVFNNTVHGQLRPNSLIPCCLYCNCTGSSVLHSGVHREREEIVSCSVLFSRWFNYSESIQSLIYSVNIFRPLVQYNVLLVLSVSYCWQLWTLSHSPQIVMIW